MTDISVISLTQYMNSFWFELFSPTYIHNIVFDIQKEPQFFQLLRNAIKCVLPIYLFIYLQLCPYFRHMQYFYCVSFSYLRNHITNWISKLIYL